MRTRGLALFFAVNFGLSWSIAWILSARGGLESTYAVSLMIAYMAGPALGALVTAWVYDRGRMKEALGLVFKPNAYWIVALILPFIIVTLSVLFSLLGHNVELVSPIVGFRDALLQKNVDTDALPLSIETLFWVQMLIGLPLGIAINALVLLSEELGWRGWLWGRWRGLGFWRSNLAIGFVWGVWHAPIIVMGYNYPGMPVWGPVIMVVFTMLMSPLIGWVREKGGSVFAASIFHGTINALAGLSLLVLSNAQMPWRGMVGLGGMFALALLWVPLLLARKGPKDPHAKTH